MVRIPSTPAHNVVGITLWLALLVPAVAVAQSPACNENCGSCAPTDLACAQAYSACTLRIADCNAKLVLFKGYVGQMGTGVTLYSLPQEYRQVLGDFFSVPLSQWRFGYSNRQPTDNATTPCDKTYFNNQSYVTDLRQGRIGGSSLDRRWKWKWLFHELAHFEQCRERGGFDAFARMWWDDLSVTQVQGFDLWELHDRMPMENAAMNRASADWDAFEKCCVDPDNGELIRPVAVSQIAGPQVLNVGTPVQLSISVDHGPAEQTYRWEFKRPSESFFRTARENAEGRPTQNGLGLDWTPTEAGQYTVRFEVRMGLPLEKVERERTFIVSTPPTTGDRGTPRPALSQLLAKIRRLEMRQVRPPRSPTGSICTTCPLDISTQQIKGALEEAGITGSVKIRVIRGRKVVANLGRHSSDRSGEFASLRTTGRANRPSDAQAGCGYTLEVLNSKGKRLGQAPICLESPKEQTKGRR